MLNNKAFLTKHVQGCRFRWKSEVLGSKRVCFQSRVFGFQGKEIRTEIETFYSLVLCVFSWKLSPTAGHRTHTLPKCLLNTHSYLKGYILLSRSVPLAPSHIRISGIYRKMFPANPLASKGYWPQIYWEEAFGRRTSLCHRCFSTPKRP